MQQVAVPSPSVDVRFVGGNGGAILVFKPLNCWHGGQLHCFSIGNLSMCGFFWRLSWGSKRLQAPMKRSIHPKALFSCASSIPAGQGLTGAVRLVYLKQSRLAAKSAQSKPVTTKKSRNNRKCKEHDNAIIERQYTPISHPPQKRELAGLCCAFRCWHPAVQSMCPSILCQNALHADCQQ